MSGEYAIRAILHLASENSGKNVQIQDISKEWDIPENFLRKIIPLLTKVGLVTSIRGNGGGIRLAKSPRDINVLEVIEAVEGTIFLNKCLFSDNFCHRSTWCSMHELWDEAQKSLKKIISNRTIQQLSQINSYRKK